MPAPDSEESGSRPSGSRSGTRTVVVVEPPQQHDIDEKYKQEGAEEDSGGDDDDDDDDDGDYDDEIEYCDCVAALLDKSVPGTPGRKGIIPYTAVYSTQQETRKIGYWLPGVPVNARITQAERNRDAGVHFINYYLYTIELEHGPFRWRVVRTYRDFVQLHNRLRVHRAAEMVRRPVRRAQEKVDEALEHVGVDLWKDDDDGEGGHHSKEDDGGGGGSQHWRHQAQCPLAGKPIRTSQHERLRRAAELVEQGEQGKQVEHRAPLASIDGLGGSGSGSGPTALERLAEAVQDDQVAQSGILPDPNIVVLTINRDEDAGENGNGGEPRAVVRTMPGLNAAISSSSNQSGVGSTLTSTIKSTSAKRSQPQRRKRGVHHLPRFPFLPDSMVQDQEQRKKQLEAWLQMLLHIPINRNHHETAEFLEVSRYSFVAELGGKRREAMVAKRPGGSRVFLGCKQFCVRHFLPWSRRWLILKDSFVCLMDPGKERLRLVLLMDSAFGVRAGGAETEGMANGLILSNRQHNLHFRCRRPEDARQWKEAIEHAMTGPGRIFRSPQRFGSSYPVRERVHAQWFVDGESFMLRAAYLCECAKEEIFIADWWLSPEIFMKRPAVEGVHWRLDEILKRRAEAGIRIFILVYKEMEMALGLNSVYTKRTLQGLHPNIKVMRHPDHYPGTGTFFWAHHEKLLIIDQLVAFVGGIDLCYGRWDDHQHRLTDLGSVQFTEQHALMSDINMKSGLRALIKAPLTLSPLGLEEDEQVGGKKEDARAESSKPPEEGVDEVDAGRGDPKKESEKKEDEEERDPNDEETAARARDADALRRLFTRRTRAVKAEATTLTVVQPAPITRRSKSDTSSSRLTAAVAKLRGRELRASDQHQQADAKSDVEDGGRTPTDLDASSTLTASARESSHSRGGRAKSEGRQQQQHRRGPRVGWRWHRQDGTDAGDGTATPTPQPTDMAQAERLYRAYVKSGAAETEKRTAGGTPPPGLSPSAPSARLGRLVGQWKRRRARKRWQQLAAAGGDELSAYELAWLKLKTSETDTCGIDGGGKLWVGKDYVNFIYKDFIELDAPFNDFVDRGVTARMPWHDIHSVVYGSAARDAARHFIQRWNATKTEKLKEDDSVPYLLPKAYDNIRVPRVFLTDAQIVNAQVVRSVSNWSSLINCTEDSIQQAYCQLIANAKHYVYIENQFFVSMIDSSDVDNEICKVLHDRILRAHQTGDTNFRVFILIPLLPGFEGDVGTPGSSSLQAVLHWTYQSLSRGDHSLFGKLKANGVEEPQNYVAVNSLRTYDWLGKKLVSELIYVHCKLLIVDDEHVIIGSANINDRSQRGNRDSEVCVVYSDVEFDDDGVLAGRPHKAGKFARSLRLQCMKEHLGLLEKCQRSTSGWPKDAPQTVSLNDPCTPAFFDGVWRDVARKNTAIYEETFFAYPTDLVKTLEELDKWKQQMPVAEYAPQQAEEALRGLRGSLVEFPLNFLCQAKLTPAITSKEGLVPTSVFT